MRRINEKHEAYEDEDEKAKEAKEEESIEGASLGVE